MSKKDFMDINEIKKILPHRYPFLLVDRVREFNKEDKSIVSIKAVSGNESFFEGHFPGHPIMPGVLVIEGMAQSGGILHCLLQNNENGNAGSVYFMSLDNVKFRSPVFPGCILEYHVKMVQMRGKIGKIEGKAYVNGQLMCEMSGTAMINA